MQISRYHLLAFAVAACLTPSLVRAYDNEAQIRARQALEEKMNQINAQPSASAAVPTNTAPKAAVSKPAPVVTNPAPAQRPSSAQQNDMQKALEEKMNQINAGQPAPAPVPAPKAAVVKSAPAPKPAPPAITATPQSTTVENPPAQTTAPGYVTTPSNDAATSDKLSEALRQKMQEVGSQPAETTAPTAATQRPARPTSAPTYAPVQSENNTPAVNPAPTTVPATAGNYAPMPQGSTRHPNLPQQPTPAPAPTTARNQPSLPSMNLPALSGPASPLSPAKQQKLDALNEQYRLDQVTPQQYHEQRAKILSEP